jgi:hypothetical protein
LRMEWRGSCSMECSGKERRKFYKDAPLTE